MTQNLEIKSKLQDGALAGLVVGGTIEAFGDMVDSRVIQAIGYTLAAAYAIPYIAYRLGPYIKGFKKEAETKQLESGDEQ